MNSQADALRTSADSARLAMDFAARGYAILPGALSEHDIAEIQGDVDDLLTEALRGAGVKSHLETPDEKYLYLKAHHPGLKSHVYDLIRFLGCLHRLAATPSLVNFVRSLTGTPLLHDSTQMRIDDRSDDRLLPLHQEMYGQISALCITAWIPLMDVDEHNGAMRVIPGSHAAGALPHRFFDEQNGYHGVREEFLAGREVVRVTVRKGDAVVFHPLLIHGSAPNRTDTIRWTFITRYNSTREIPYLASQSAPLRIEQTAE